MQTQLKHELNNIISGKSEVRFGTIIQTIACYIDNGTSTGSTAKGSKQFKEQEAKRLENFISEHKLWVNDIDFSQYISEGAEQRVFLKDSDHVLKLNDSVYYSSWQDYFYNLLLHNFFFPDTAYDLKGFINEGNVLYSVVEQPYVLITENTYLSLVKSFMSLNGFQNTRNNDYENHDLGIILEDLHDENVLTKNGVLYFIDTVFYLTEKFWS